MRFSRGNNCTPCCEGREPTLRVRPLVRSGLEIPYVRYECRKCQRPGGLGITEAEAWDLWETR